VNKTVAWIPILAGIAGLGFGAFGGSIVGDWLSPPDVQYVAEEGATQNITAPDPTQSSDDGLWGELFDMLPMILMLLMALK
jgi:hypothetical protein